MQLWGCLGEEKKNILPFSMAVSAKWSACSGMGTESCGKNDSFRNGVKFCL
jgi:hypothetical protein